MELGQVKNLGTQEGLADIAMEIGVLLGVPSMPDTDFSHAQVPPQVVAAARVYRDFLIKAIIEERINPRNDLEMLRLFLDSHSLKLPFEAETYIAPGDIVEIYCEDMVQIYRNRTFFEFCSYDLYTILSQPFDVLYRRDPAVSKRLVERGMECFTTMKGIELTGVPKNLMQEHFARNSKVFEIEQKWLSPVISKITGKTVGIFATQRAERKIDSNVVGIGFVNA